MEFGGSPLTAIVENKNVFIVVGRTRKPAAIAALKSCPAGYLRLGRRR